MRTGMVELLLIGIVMLFLLIVGVGASILFFRQLRREQKMKSVPPRGSGWAGRPPDDRGD
jgi:hypothetical protein